MVFEEGAIKSGIWVAPLFMPDKFLICEKRDLEIDVAGKSVFHLGDEKAIAEAKGGGEDLLAADDEDIPSPGKLESVLNAARGIGLSSLDGTGVRSNDDVMAIWEAPFEALPRLSAHDDGIAERLLAKAAHVLVVLRPREFSSEADGTVRSMRNNQGYTAFRHRSTIKPPRRP